VVAQQLGDFGTVGRVFVDAQLEVLGEGFVELLLLLFVLRELVEEFDGLLHQVLSHHP
jgi:hypothetical protein